MTNLLTLWRENRGWYWPRYTVYPACRECQRLFPEMVFAMSIWNFCESSYTTRCCDCGTYDWKFVVGTRRGKVNLTVRSRVAAVQERGVWCCLGM